MAEIPAPRIDNAVQSKSVRMAGILPLRLLPKSGENPHPSSGRPL
jgi:hypothetical protein